MEHTVCLRHIINNYSMHGTHCMFETQNKYLCMGRLWNLAFSSFKCGGGKVWGRWYDLGHS